MLRRRSKLRQVLS
ncbi:hypothetical protein V2J09_016259 [Rumex salicifolius]